MGVRSGSDNDSRFILFFSHFVPAQKFNSQTGQNLPKIYPVYSFSKDQRLCPERLLEPPERERHSLGQTAQALGSDLDD